MKWWVVLCGFGALLASAEARSQSAPSSPPSQAETVPSKPAAQDTTSGAPADSKPSHTSKTQTHKETAAKKPASGAATHHATTTTAHKRRTVSPRVARMRQAFVASA